MNQDQSTCKLRELVKISAGSRIIGESRRFSYLRSIVRPPPEVMGQDRHFHHPCKGSSWKDENKNHHKRNFLTKIAEHTISTMRSSRLVLNISRMLDLGGMPSASTAKAMRSVDASKNCKVKCLAFDFDLLTRTVVDNREKVVEPVAVAAATPSPILPDVGMLQQMANLLNIKLGESPPTASKEPDDDLPALTTKGKDKKQSNNPLAGADIRNKYASKLRNRGGVAGIELAKQEAENFLTKGDAAGHLAARAIAANQGNTETPKWMASTGTGSLLQYVSNRSMKIALLPLPDNGKVDRQGQRMEEFTKQIPQVTFDVLLTGGEDVSKILKDMLGKLSLDPLSCMVISDRDDYLRNAKEVGMTTCRVRPHANAPRGNTTAHYTVESMAEVQDVVNDINGISFKAVSAGSS